MDYVRSLDPQIIPYNDEDEDQHVQPGEILNHRYRDELSLDSSVYNRHPTSNISNCRDVDPPMKDMYAVRFICMPHVLISECAPVWENGMAIFTITKESTGQCTR